VTPIRRDWQRARSRRQNQLWTPLRGTSFRTPFPQ